ncbi:MAG: RNase adapter RapZ [Aerococcus sp.]|nr:RNase adapter RapZ [Aerococcus sp.]
MLPDHNQLMIITGMSGAGKTIAMQSFEDMGYFCVDNMPPSLMSKFFELINRSSDINKICLVVDLRSGHFFDHVTDALAQNTIDSRWETHVVFLEASDAALVRRYKETRRTHPLSSDGLSTLDAIQDERRRLQPIRALSDEIIDTGNLRPRELRELLMHQFNGDSAKGFTIETISFGFKHGIPIDSDIVMDVRFLPNPHYVTELRPKTGLDQEVSDYVTDKEETQQFMAKFLDMLDYTVPMYEAEGKSSLTIAIGCTGGRHRSVTLTERTAQHLSDTFDYPVHVKHRDINRAL